MDLYIIRHAWAAERDSSRWPNDELRPLTDEGRERFARVAKQLVRRGVAPQRIATSPLVRCQETAQLLADALPEQVEIVPLDELRPGRELEGILRWTTEQSRQHARIAWVGHSPDVAQLTAGLIGRSDDQIRFAKGTSAHIKFDGSPTIAGGELQWLATAKILGC